MVQKSITSETFQVKGTIDVKGTDCPFQMLKTKKLFSSFSSGEILQISGVNDHFLNDLLSWCERTGHFYLGKNMHQGESIVFLKKG